MNANVVCAIQNVQGRFLQYYALNRLELAADLFASTPDVHLWIPDRGIDATGAENVAAALKGICDKRIAKGYERDYYLYNCPVFHVSEDEKDVRGTYDSYSFEVIKNEEGEYGLEFFSSRFDCTYVKEDDEWKCASMDWYEIVSFVPWKLDPKDDYGRLTDVNDLPLPPTGKISAEDFQAIQKLQAHFSHDNRRWALEDLFLDSDDISFRMQNLFDGVCKGRAEIAAKLAELAEKEKLNKNMALSIPLITSPVIAVEPDGKTAKGSWLVMTYDIKATAFGREEPNYQIVRNLGYMQNSYVKTEKGWRIVDFDLKIILSQTPEAYDPVNKQTRYHRMTQLDNTWKYSGPALGGNFPDDACEVESLLPHWLNAVRRGDVPPYIREHMHNDREEIIFESKLLGRNAQPVVGLEPMIDKFSATPFQYHHQQVCYHSDTTPIIEVSADGKYATAWYFDQSWTPYDIDLNRDTSKYLVFDSGWNSKTSGSKRVLSMSLLSKYLHKFVKVDGEWKHYNIYWEPIICFPDWELAGDRSRGWAGADTDVVYPKIWEKYRYTPKRKCP